MMDKRQKSENSAGNVTLGTIWPTTQSVVIGIGVPCGFDIGIGIGIIITTKEMEEKSLALSEL